MNRSKKLNIKTSRGLPKYLKVLDKSKYIRRWLVRNPWLRPISTFNYAAVQIQKIARGCLCRRRSSKRSIFLNKKAVLKRQLDKYISSLDKYKTSKIALTRPKWLDGGYSSWCLCRIQSWWRMIKTWQKFRQRLRFVNQIAVLIIQMSWKSYKQRLKANRNMTATLTIIEANILASSKIQLCWRSFCNKRIFKYFRDLIRLKLKGAPHELLRTIIPNESDLLDRASGVHVRFRLGGIIFPPRIYFKIFTHRPLCDVNAFAPRDYSQERSAEYIHAREIAARFVDPKKSLAASGTGTGTVIRVGKRYFGTKVTTTVDLNQWYCREENNPWRPIASQVISDNFSPPWLPGGGLHKSKPGPFHYSRLQRKQDIAAQKKVKKRQWMLKAYMLAASEIVATEVDRFIDPNAIVNHMENIKIDKSNAYFKDNLDNVPILENKSHSDDRSFKGSLYSSKSSVGIYQNYDQIRYASSPPSTNDKGKGYQYANKIRADIAVANFLNENVEPDDLVKWSMALDFDEYARDWSQLATSMPSDVDYKEMYKVAAENSEEVRSIYSDFKRK